MDSRYYILLSIKTLTGFDTYGEYYLGNDHHIADDLFSQLKGNRTITTNALLHLDLMETTNGLPLKIKTISCTLDELAYNTKLIAREVFKLKNLEEME